MIKNVKGVSKMPSITDVLEALEKKAKSEAEFATRKEIARSLLADKMSLEQVVKHSKLSLAEVKALAQEQKK